MHAANLVVLHSKHDSSYTCRIPTSDLRLEYTLDSKLPETSLLNILSVVRHRCQISVNIGFGDKLIGPPDGHYRYGLGGVSFSAVDNSASALQDFTWNNLLEIATMTGYCGPGKGIFREIEAKVYIGDVWIGNVHARKVTKFEKG